MKNVRLASPLLDYRRYTRARRMVRDRMYRRRWQSLAPEVDDERLSDAHHPLLATEIERSKSRKEVIREEEERPKHAELYFYRNKSLIYVCNIYLD